MSILQKSSQPWKSEIKVIHAWQDELPVVLTSFLPFEDAMLIFIISNII